MLEEFEAKYHVADKELGIAKEKLKLNVGFEVVSSASLALSGLVGGYAFYLQDKEIDTTLPWIVATALLIAGIYAKVAKR